jgi:hypothetical protein
VTGGAGYIGSHSAKGAAGSRLSRHHLRQPLGRAPLGGARRAAHRRRHPGRRGGAAGAARHRRRGGDALCRVAERRRLGGRSGRLLPQQRDGHAGHARAMAAESCARFVFSSTCAVYGEPVETPIRETHPTAPINAYGQTKLAIEHALPHYERGWGLQSIRLRYFNAAGAGFPTVSWARTTTPRSTPFRARSRRPPAAPSSDPGHRLSDAGRHLPARLHPRDRSRRRPRARAAPARSGRAVADLQPRYRASDLGARDHCRRRAGDGAAGGPVGGAPAARRPGDPLRLGRSGRATSSGGCRRGPGIDTIVGDAWAWHQKARDAAAPGSH